MQLVSLGHFYLGTNQLLDLFGEFLSAVTSIDQDILHLAQVFGSFSQSHQGSCAVGHVGCGHAQGMGEALCVHCNMAFDPGDFLARIISLLPGGIGVLDTLCVNDEEGCLCVPPKVYSDRAN